MLKVEHISKDYGPRKPVEDVSFTLERGEVLGLLGANGTGKSTTLNMIAGYFPATSGSIVLNGHCIEKEPLLYRQGLGYLPEVPPLYPDMTVNEQLTMVCSARGIPRKERSREIDRVCRLTQISEMKKRPVKAMSKGYKQRIGMAQALIGDPGLLILDEPTSGLDPQQIIDIRKLIDSLGRDHAVIISSHILSEIASVATRIVVLNRGHIAADSPADELMKTASGESVLEVRIFGEEAEAAGLINSMQGVLSLKTEDCPEPGCLDYSIQLKEGTDIRKKLSTALPQVSCAVMQMKMKNPTLEDVFIDLVSEREGS